MHSCAVNLMRQKEIEQNRSRICHIGKRLKENNAHAGDTYPIARHLATHCYTGVIRK